MRSNKTKEQIYRNIFSLFSDVELPNEILKEYLYLNDSYNLQLWLVSNMKDELSDWCTGIGIIESAEHLYQCALENGNLSFELTFGENES